MKKKTNNSKVSFSTKVKDYYTQYKKDFQVAFDSGYKLGWENRDKIPNRKGTALASTTGYSSGLRDRKIYNKIQKHVYTRIRDY